MIGYELTFITRQDLTDEALKSFIEKIKGIITAHEGQVVHMEDWGRRKLAYAIEKETRGHYTFITFTGNNSLVAEIERNLRINEFVMRFLTVKLEKDFDVASFKRPITVAYNPNAQAQGASPYAETR